MSSYSANTVPGAGGWGAKNNRSTAHLSTSSFKQAQERRGDREFNQQGRQYSWPGQGDEIKQEMEAVGENVMETRGDVTVGVLEISEMVANFSCQMEVALRFPPRQGSRHPQRSEDTDCRPFTQEPVSEGTESSTRGKQVS